MDDQKLRTFNAIGAFVQDLNSGFGQKNRPIALYNRLIEKTTLQDEAAIDRHINAFKKFYSANSGYVKNGKFSGDPKITYSDRVFLDVSKVCKKLDDTAIKHIHRHLVTIYSLIYVGTEQGTEALETLKETTSEPIEFDLDVPDTTEGKFIQDTLTEMTSQFQDLDAGGNPMQMMNSMMQSGFFTNFMGDMQEKMGSGEMNLGSLMSTVTSVISQATPGDDEGGAEIREMVSNTLGAVTGGNGEFPEEMNDLMSAFGMAPPGQQQEEPVLEITDGDEE